MKLLRIFTLLELGLDLRCSHLGSFIDSIVSFLGLICFINLVHDLRRHISGVRVVGGTVQTSGAEDVVFLAHLSVLNLFPDV